MFAANPAIMATSIAAVPQRWTFWQAPRPLDAYRFVAPARASRESVISRSRRSDNAVSSSTESESKSKRRSLAAEEGAVTQPSWSVYSLRGSLGSTQLASTTAMPRPPLWISSGAEPSVVAGVPSWWYAQKGGRGWGRGEGWGWGHGGTVN